MGKRGSATPKAGNLPKVPKATPKAKTKADPAKPKGSAKRQRKEETPLPVISPEQQQIYREQWKTQGFLKDQMSCVLGACVCVCVCVCDSVRSCVCVCVCV